MTLKRIIVWLFCTPAISWAVSSFDMSGSVGIYRDIHEREHLPLFYTLRYSELYSHGVRAQFDLILNNDLADSDWQLMTSQANVYAPIGEQTQDGLYPPSSLQLGRQSFLGPFEFSLLDGAQWVHHSTSQTGYRLFGGSQHPMDLADPEGIPLVGGEFFTRVATIDTRLGAAWRSHGLSEQNPWISLSREFPSLPWIPALLAKLETDDQWQERQSLAELTLNPWDGFFLSTMVSHRIPHRILADENLFLYRILASTPQRTLEQSFNLALNSHMTVVASLRWLAFGNGADNSRVNEAGRQQYVALAWEDARDYFQLPAVTHIESYGGELWDASASWRHKQSERTATTLEGAVAHFDKINQITGWAFHLRSGLEWRAAQNFFISSIGEIERNPYFAFDLRALVNVTFYN